jgi:hypothetical protein
MNVPVKGYCNKHVSTNFLSLQVTFWQVVFLAVNVDPLFSEDKYEMHNANYNY